MLCGLTAWTGRPGAEKTHWGGLWEGVRP